MLSDLNASLKRGDLLSLKHLYRKFGHYGNIEYLAPFRAGFPAILFFWLSLHPENKLMQFHMEMILQI